MTQISIVIPSLNEVDVIAPTLDALQPLRNRGHELILVDGGSLDGTIAFAESLVDKIIQAPRSRAGQMNRGAEEASGEILFFLHADTLIPDNADAMILDSIANGHLWGRFNVMLSGSHPFFRVIENLMNWRSCLSSIVTGDMGMFVLKDKFEAVGRYPEIPLMEDIAISINLKRLSRAHCIPQNLVTSSRRWEQNGIVKTVLTMWLMRTAYFIGVPADKLAEFYYRY